MRPFYQTETKVSIMKSTIHWESQPKAIYNNLDFNAYEEVSHCVQLLKLGKPLINEVPLLSVPGMKVAWLQSGYVLMFTRQRQSNYWRSQVVISITHIVQNDRLIPAEFFRLGEGVLSSSTPVKKVTKVLDDSQRIAFSLQIGYFFISLLLALFVLFGPQILSKVTTSKPDTPEEETSLNVSHFSKAA